MAIPLRPGAYLPEPQPAVLAPVAPAAVPGGAAPGGSLLAMLSALLGGEQAATAATGPLSRADQIRQYGLWRRSRGFGRGYGQPTPEAPGQVGGLQPVAPVGEFPLLTGLKSGAGLPSGSPSRMRLLDESFGRKQPVSMGSIAPPPAPTGISEYLNGLAR